MKPENVIFGRERQRKSKGRLTSGWYASIEIKTPLAFEIDCRALVEWISVNLAWHYRNEALAGQEPDDGDRVPGVTSWTKRVSGGDRRRDTVMLRTGWGADRWWLGDIKGNPHSAWRAIKPYGGNDGPRPKNGAGRDLLWNVMLKRGYDPQGVTGRSKIVIANTLADWLTTTVGVAPGIDLKTVGQTTLRDTEGA